MTATEDLEDVIKNGLVSDIFTMEQAYELLSTIGANADSINGGQAGNFGELFGAIQGSLEQNAILAIARVYDRPSRKYPTRCLRRALAILEEGASELPELVELPNIKRSLARMGVGANVIEAVDSGRDVFISEFVASFSELLDSEEVVKAIESLKYLRDKRIAHNEAAAPHGPTWEALRSLTLHAQNFVVVMGWAFFNTVYSADGRYFLSDDAKRPSRALVRLFRRLNTG